MNSLREKTISGMLWSAMERFGYMFVMFVSNLFLARLLSPDDFGLIGMILVFVSIALIIVDGGFASALIQKEEIEEADYSTAFYINVGFAVILYIAFYFVAPMVAGFYADGRLTVLLRVLGITLILNSFSVVQIAKVKRELNFRYLSIVSIVSSLVGCSAGVIAAFCSMGVWSLVIQNLVISGMKSFVLFVSSKWKPRFIFSLRSLKKQFGFGSMVLFSNLTDTLYGNSVPLILGKMFPPQTLGLYTQARTLENVPNQTLTAIVNQVTFPIFSRMQDDPAKLLTGIRKVSRCLVWINFPLMILLFLIADPLFRILYTDKWIGAVPLFQIACCGGLVASLVQLNLSLLLSQGHSLLSFYCRFVRQGFAIIFIVMIAFTHDLLWIMIVCVAFMPYFFLIVSIYYTKKKIPAYGFRKQIGDVADVFLVTLLCGCFTYICDCYIPDISDVSNLLITTVLFCSFYFIASKYLLSKIFQVYLIEAKNVYKKIFHKQGRASF